MTDRIRAASRRRFGGLLAALTQVVGSSHVLTDPDLCAPYETDWTRRFSGSASAVVRPGSVEEAAGVLALCAPSGATVVPQGGNTGLVGGSVPRGGEVVLSLARLAALGTVDHASLQVEAGAGVTLADLQRHASAAGLDPAVDFAARDSATVGGMVACDAGGTRAVRYGTVRARIAGLEAVLADGSIVRGMSGRLKDNAGYDLASLLIGSEGTLGVITRARWRLVPRLERRAAALVQIGSLAEAADLITSLRPRLSSLEACDFITDAGLGLVLEHLNIAAPVENRSHAYVIVECAATVDPLAELADALASAGVDDALVADDSDARRRLWRLRDAHPEAIAAAGVPHKLDVGVPVEHLAEFSDRLQTTLSQIAPGSRLILFGHLGDGNVHVNVLGTDPDDEALDETILRLAASYGGTISAEHGVGVAKARWLGLARSEPEIAAMTSVKRALDPDGLLNPGAVLNQMHSTSAGVASVGRVAPAELA